jgi:peptide/nickel transport system permease protein
MAGMVESMRITRLVALRLATAVPTVFLATAIVFLLQRLIPGDPAVAAAGENGTPEAIAAIREQLGLNHPLPVQYWEWLKGIFEGDFGTSIQSSQPTLTMIADRFPPSLIIWIGSLIISIGLGIPAGIRAARSRNRLADQAITSTASIGIAVPSFWLGMVLVLFFSLQLDWFPATGSVPFLTSPLESIRSAVLPSVALGCVGAAEVARQVRGAMIEVLTQDHIRTDHAKGLRPFDVTWRHALKNASLPIATIIGLLMGRIISGSVVVETVFGVSGVGSLLVQAVNGRDYPVVQGVVLIVVVLVLLINFVIDLGYRVLDPRLRTA